MIFLSQGKLYDSIDDQNMDQVCTPGTTVIYAVLKDHQDGQYVENTVHSELWRDTYQNVMENICELWGNTIETNRLSVLQGAIVERGHLLVSQ